MAYLVEKTYACKSCGKRANHELRNKVNAPQGMFCAKCGSREMRKLQAHEDAQIAASPEPPTGRP